VHQITSYNKQALWDAVQIWFDGGPVASGEVNLDGAALHEFPGRGGATWEIYPEGTEKEEKVPVEWNSFATPFAPDRNTFGYKWNSQQVKHNKSPDRHLVLLPEYFRLGQNSKQMPVWSPVPASEVPAETGLADVRFDRKRYGPPKTYETPEEADSCWKKPGPKAGPFKAKLGDGSVVTYYWYRFADQPAILNADMSDAEREAIQKRVELLHRYWTKDRKYLAPPASGQLADLDPALIVTPPKNLEIGYVPIVTRQEPDGNNKSLGTNALKSPTFLPGKRQRGRSFRRAMSQSFAPFRRSARASVVTVFFSPPEPFSSAADRPEMASHPITIVAAQRATLALDKLRLSIR
jgi:hypothetical protein